MLPAYQLRNIRDGFATAFLCAIEQGYTAEDKAIILARFELANWHYERALRLA